MLDLALHCGYLDLTTPFAFSAPVSIDVPGISQIRVGAGRSRPTHPFGPPHLDWDDSGLTISHFCCHLEHPERVQAILRLVLTAAARKRGCIGHQAASLVDQAMTDLFQANLLLLQQLETAAAPIRSKTPVAELLIQAAERQGEIFRKTMTPCSERQHDAGAAQS